MATIFSRIVKGEIPCYKIAENKRFFAFMDINPVAVGHTLVIPKREDDYIFNLDDEELGAMMVFAKKVAKAIEKAVPCKRIGVAVIGLEVPHAHIHLIPITQEIREACRTQNQCPVGFPIFSGSCAKWFFVYICRKLLSP